MSLKDTLSRLFKPSRTPVQGVDDIPTSRRTVLTSLAEPMALAHSLSADRLHGILRAAESGECEQLFAVYRELRFHAHFQAVFNQRKLAALTKALAIVASDEKKTDDVAAQEACLALTQSPGWLAIAMNHLLNGHLYPLAVLEQVYAVNHTGRWPGVRFIPVQWLPVPYRLLDWTAGNLQVWDAEPKLGHRLGTRFVPQAPQFVVHRGHLLTDIPDNWGGPMRAALFWWLFAVMDRDWWVRFLDRFGAPFIVGRYDAADEASKTLLAKAFAAATRLFGLVVSRETEIQVHAVATASHGEAFEKMQVFANGELSKLVLGQTMTTSAAPGGIGGTQANVQESVRGDIEAWDITALAETVNRDIIAPFLRFNGLAGNAELKITTATGAEMQSQAAFLTAASQAGLEPTDAGIAQLSKSSGIPLQRGPATRPALGLSAFQAATTEKLLDIGGQPTNKALDLIAATAAARLATAFRGRYAPVRAMLEDATDAKDLEARLAAFARKLEPGLESRLLEETLTAYAATGAASGRFS